MSKDGNGQGMDRVEQYNTHTHIVDWYKKLPVLIPMDMKLYPYPYPVGIPAGRKLYTCSTHD
jgi:hypothetical protein